jgi:hypothetical protein
LSRWPVDEPIDPRPPRINLRGVPPDPATFDGPLNVFIGLHATAVANNTAEQTRQDYDTLHPATPEAAAESRPLTEEDRDHPPVNEPQPQPQPQPVSPGRPIVYSGNFIVDPEIEARVQRHHTRPPRYR